MLVLREVAMVQLAVVRLLKMVQAVMMVTFVPIQMFVGVVYVVGRRLLVQILLVKQRCVMVRQTVPWYLKQMGQHVGGVINVVVGGVVWIFHQMKIIVGVVGLNVQIIIVVMRHLRDLVIVLVGRIVNVELMGRHLLVITMGAGVDATVRKM
jgi:hypothetical protein